MSEYDVTVQLVGGDRVDLDGVTGWEVDGPFLQLATATGGVCLFKADEVRSVTPRSPAPEDSAVIPVASLQWRLKAWCVVGPASGEIVNRFDTLEDAQRAVGISYSIVREEAVTLTRLVPFE